MAEKLIIAEELVKKYRMGEVDVYALKRVNCTLYEQELVVVLGASGSGKTTLVNLLRHRP